MTTKKKSKESIKNDRSRVISGYGPHKMLRLEMRKIREKETENPENL